MILTSRLLLIAVLVSWQALPALSYTNWIELPLWGKADKSLSVNDSETAQPTLTDALSDPAELLTERTSPQNGPLLALLPEVSATESYKSFTHLFDTYHSVLTGSSAFLYRDRGPPLLLPS